MSNQSFFDKCQQYRLEKEALELRRQELNLHIKINTNLDLTVLTCLVLLNLQNQNKSNVVKIAKDLRVTHPAMNGVLAKLKKLKLVESLGIDPKDLRKINYQLTSKGVDVLEKLQASCQRKKGRYE